MLARVVVPPAVSMHGAISRGEYRLLVTDVYLPGQMAVVGHAALAKVPNRLLAHDPYSSSKLRARAAARPAQPQHGIQLIGASASTSIL